MAGINDRELTEEDRLWIFRTATQSFAERYADEIEAGMNDRDLAAALEAALGIFGGSGGPDVPAVTFMGAGLRIWGGWRVINHVREKPLYAGKATIAMARQAYGIANPDERQLKLF